MSARIAILAAVALGLAACSEPSQELVMGKNTGEPAFKGTGSNFTAPGWTPGDQASWVRELKVRAQRGQNEYTRIN